MKRYLIKAAITKGDGVGCVMQAIVSGSQCATDELWIADKRVERLLALFSCLSGGQFMSYGLISVIDEDNGCVVRMEHVPNPEKIKIKFDTLKHGVEP